FMRLHFVFCDDAAATEIYTPSLLDALPISSSPDGRLLGTGEGGELGSQIARPDTDLVEWSDSDKVRQRRTERNCGGFRGEAPGGDRKSTRLNSSHVKISYAVFCLKKKRKTG